MCVIIAKAFEKERGAKAYKTVAVVELADTTDLKSVGRIIRTGSIPVSGTKSKQSSLCFDFFYPHKAVPSYYI